MNAYACNQRNKFLRSKRNLHKNRCLRLPTIHEEVLDPSEHISLSHSFSTMAAMMKQRLPQAYREYQLLEQHDQMMEHDNSTSYVNNTSNTSNVTNTSNGGMLNIASPKSSIIPSICKPRSICILLGSLLFVAAFTKPYFFLTSSSSSSSPSNFAHNQKKTNHSLKSALSSSSTISPISSISSSSSSSVHNDTLATISPQTRQHQQSQQLEPPQRTQQTQNQKKNTATQYETLLQESLRQSKPQHQTSEKNKKILKADKEHSNHDPAEKPILSSSSSSSESSTSSTSSAPQNPSEQTKRVASTAPLFYHISPGSTGSRTLYHAACQAGFPSVHHKSFCISQTRGIGSLDVFDEEHVEAVGGSDGVGTLRGGGAVKEEKGRINMKVDAEVAEGVRAHFELLRLYQLAGECCRLWGKGKLPNAHNAHDAYDAHVAHDTYESQDAHDSTNDPLIALCHTPINEWAQNITTHLTNVLQSGVVGLFDTPYPYLAPQIMELVSTTPLLQPDQLDASKNHTKKSQSLHTSSLRETAPFIAMTERDPQSWAKSRSTNHGLMVCKKEFSYEMLGASEFDILGCVQRALDTKSAAGGKGTTATTAATHESAEVLHFWDVFQYRSHFEPLDDDFQLGLERQMEHHQQLYLPLANYTPDFFGAKLSESQKGEGTGKAIASAPPAPRPPPMGIDDVAIDITKIILFPDAIEAANKKTGERTTTDLHFSWREMYNKPLTCRGRVNWEMTNDTLVEIYHLPKTCGISSSKAGKESKSSKVENTFIPLIET